MSSTAPDRKRTAPAAALLALVGALLCGWAPPLKAEDARVRQSQQELERLRERMQALARRLEQQRGQKSELRAELEQAEKNVVESIAALQRLRRDIEAQNQRLQAAVAQRAQAQAQLDRQKQALAGQVRAAYLMGNRAPAQLLLNLDDAARLGRLMTYADYLHRARAQQLAAIDAQLGQIAALEKRLAGERERLQALETEQAQTVNRLEAGRNERRRMLATIDASLASGAEELSQLQAQERAIQQLLESLRDALADIPADLGQQDKPFAQLRGKLPWPLRGPVLADYGSAKAGGPLRWSGRWIGAKEGAPVKAVARGRVAYVGWLQRYGLMVILEHDGGYFTLYAHNASARPSVGEWVGPGEVIGAAGNTGGHEQTGVYLEIRKGSIALDPRGWLRP